MPHAAPFPTFDADGFEVLPALVGDAALEDIAARLAGRAGIGERELLDEAWCAELARHLHADPRVAHALPRAHRAVQCTSFEKSAARNWLVPVDRGQVLPRQSLSEQDLR